MSPWVFVAAPVTLLARGEMIAHHRGRADKEVALPTKADEDDNFFQRMSKKSIISLGLQRIFLIRQNIIAQSLLLEQEAQATQFHLMFPDVLWGF